MKTSKVIFIDNDLEKAFDNLNENDPIKKALKRAIETIKEDCYFGRQVKKNLIPKSLTEKYNLNNLWIYNLPSSWRLLYSLPTSGELGIMSVILDWMDHKDYE